VCGEKAAEHPASARQEMPGNSHPLKARTTTKKWDIFTHW